MEMEIEEKFSQRFEISESAAVKNSRTNNSENKFYATLGIEINRQAEEDSFLEMLVLSLITIIRIKTMYELKFIPT